MFVKSQSRVLESFVLSLCLVWVISLGGLSFVSLADVNDLMIGTGSNALMTMELDDEDYAVMPLSSIATVDNTIDSSSLSGHVYISDVNGKNGRFSNFTCTLENGRYKYSYTAPDGFYVRRIFYRFYGADMPRPGSYTFSMDVASHISYEHGSFYIYWLKLHDNVSDTGGNLYPPFTSDSGDLYVAPFAMDVSNIYYMDIYQTLDSSENISVIGGSFAVNFTITGSGDYPSVGGADTSNQDYQSDVSSSLSDLSSSVGEMSEEISGVTEAIQNLQGAMEPHYSNVLTQLHHITEQLHAFYDQIYNNIHLKEYALWQDIKTAIENIDLEVNVNLDKLKTSIDNMSTAIQNKLQSVSDQITGGYDNSGIVSDQTELDSALNEYQEAEDELFEDAKEHIGGFEFDTQLDDFAGPLGDVSYFLSGMFTALGPMNVVISFSLTLTIAMVMIGWYRFKGGR